MSSTDDESQLVRYAGAGDLENVKLCVSRGVEVNTRRLGWLPLEYSAYHGHTNVCGYLIEKKAKVNLSYASLMTTFTIVAKKDHYELVKLLVEKKADVDQRGGKNRDTALLFAAWRGNMEIVKYLVTKAKANISIASKKGDTPLIAAAYCSHLPVVRFLVEEGKVVSSNRNPFSFFFCCSKEKNEEQMDL
mmetsp:Transcript_29208/g.56892  ORF Transcript_29208/g.56892 Transcript_29208/m.56892 type:complete len:190 (-) Transcript_29208:29-598(-)